MKKKNKCLDGLVYTHDNKLIKEQDSYVVINKEFPCFPGIGEETTEIVYHKDDAPKYENCRSYPRSVHSGGIGHIEFFLEDGRQVNEDGTPYGYIKDNKEDLKKALRKYYLWVCTIGK